MSDKYLPNLGETPHADAQRDAVHIAVVPLKARCKYRLYPGCSVKLVPGRTDSVMEVRNDYDPDCIGVVDPFRKEPANDGDMCWVFLKPNSISYLRHAWEHPAFDIPSKMSEAETWLRTFAADNAFDFDGMMKAATSSDYDAHVVASNDLDISSKATKEFWYWVEKYTGNAPDQRKVAGFGFSCSC